MERFEMGQEELDVERFWCKSKARPDRFRRSIEGDTDYAARAPCQISGILAIRPPSLPIFN